MERVGTECLYDAFVWLRLCSAVFVVRHLHCAVVRTFILRQLSFEKVFLFVLLYYAPKKAMKI